MLLDCGHCRAQGGRPGVDPIHPAAVPNTLPFGDSALLPRLIVRPRDLDDSYGTSGVRTLDMDEELHHPAGLGWGLRTGTGRS